MIGQVRNSPDVATGEHLLDVHAATVSAGPTMNADASAKRGTRLIRLLERLGSLLDERVPLGYEDETGFHFGTFPTPGGSH